MCAPGPAAAPPERQGGGHASRPVVERISAQLEAICDPPSTSWKRRRFNSLANGTGVALSSDMHRQAHRLQMTLRGLVAAALLTVAGPVVANATESTRLEITLRDGRLSAHVVEAAFTRVLGEIASQLGASVTGVDPADVAPMTVTFSDLPPAAALERLLQGRSHFVTYGAGPSGARVRRIVLLSGGTSVLAPAAPALAPEAEHVPRFEASPDQVDAMLAGALDLLTSGLTLGAPEIRRQVLDEVSTWQLHDPSRAVLLARLSSDPDPEVREAALQVLQAGRPQASGTVGIRTRRQGRRA